ncbi:unnamed protein product, partial [marine sediment metagenome]
ITKNSIPVEISYPEDEQIIEDFTNINGLVLDPIMGDSYDFEKYALWYKEGQGEVLETEFYDPSLEGWKKSEFDSELVVPVHLQDENDPDYPNSNVSYYPVINETIGYFNIDNLGLNLDDWVTLLLIAYDKNTPANYQLDYISIQYGTMGAGDTDYPIVTILNPDIEFTVNTRDEEYYINYNLDLNGTESADIIVDIIKLESGNPKEVVFHRKVTAQTGDGDPQTIDGTVIWKGKRGEDQSEFAPYVGDTHIYIDVLPPKPPVLISPSDNYKTDNLKPEFRWDYTEDDISGVDKYILQIDDDINFSSPIEVELSNLEIFYTPPDDL